MDIDYELKSLVYGFVYAIRTGNGSGLFAAPGTHRESQQYVRTKKTNDPANTRAARIDRRV